ncbi:protein Rta [Common bottlenose dolphin gammaherpesvirus 1 strain Sarasota]|uniref:Protein Rta n=1 Tax=Common bottlenose dolphin gammaherpesvirus 1 strain Sarasota TaxID=2022783 RepID=A0A1Z1NEH2_9GAMA|nr:protein Rta [Common bottlenose dolphin gammaherpesvirus 1 strain Sarasota]ARW78112.1 protein Rta [Common bottlenose dolphin gammaherpesvirus 1 strain Sarasota]
MPARAKMPRPNCVDDFLLVSKEAKALIYKAVQGYCAALNKSSENCHEITTDTHQACFKLIQSACQIPYIGGLVGTLNLCNLWTMFRNFKGKKKSMSESMACASFASHFVRHLIEKLIFETDKFFLCAPCSGIQVPKELATAMFNLLSDTRKRALGQSKMFGTGRAKMMSTSKELIELYLSMDSQGLLSQDVKKFMHIIFLMPNINEQFKQLYEWEQECQSSTRRHKTVVHVSPRQRAPNRSVFSDAETRFKYVIPNCLIMETYTTGERVYVNPDISKHMLNVSGSYQEVADPSPDPQPQPTEEAPPRKRLRGDGAPEPTPAQAPFSGNPVAGSPQAPVPAPSAAFCEACPSATNHPSENPEAPSYIFITQTQLNQISAPEDTFCTSFNFANMQSALTPHPAHAAQAGPESPSLIPESTPTICFDTTLPIDARYPENDTCDVESRESECEYAETMALLKELTAPSSAAAAANYADCKWPLSCPESSQDDGYVSPPLTTPMTYANDSTHFSPSSPMHTLPLSENLDPGQNKVTSRHPENYYGPPEDTGTSSIAAVLETMRSLEEMGESSQEMDSENHFNIESLNSIDSGYDDGSFTPMDSPRRPESHLQETLQSVIQSLELLQDCAGTAGHASPFEDLFEMHFGNPKSANRASDAPQAVTVPASPLTTQINDIFNTLKDAAEGYELFSGP